jgi:hypothetical protein
VIGSLRNSIVRCNCGSDKNSTRHLITMLGGDEQNKRDCRSLVNQLEAFCCR